MNREQMIDYILERLAYYPRTSQAPAWTRAELETWSLARLEAETIYVAHREEKASQWSQDGREEYLKQKGRP